LKAELDDDLQKMKKRKEKKSQKSPKTFE